MHGARRPGEPGAASPLQQACAWQDVLLLVLAVAVLVGAGLGLRDPWPADEPRFASLARDLLASGDWLFPRVGGDLYQDKPPFYFWLLALAYGAFGAFRGWFLLPSLLAALGVVLLVYDMARRIAGREAGLLAGLGLAATLQFVLTMRGAQIDGTLVLLTTLSLYALLRHLLFGPAWGWYTLGGLAAGLGVITKGVGFLPILLLLPYAWMRRSGWSGLAPLGRGGARWALAPLALLAGICLWFVPMLIAVALRGDPALVAYRDEILLQQTLTRYAQAWHHGKPWYYFLVEVIPPLWLPWSVLLPWLVPGWRRLWRAREARSWLPLAWVALVLVFFSLSTGKRGVYIFPALPALAIAAAPLLPHLRTRRGAGWALLALAGVLVLGGIAFTAAQLLGLESVRRLLEANEIRSIRPAVAFAIAGSIGLILAARRAPLAAWPLVLACLAIAWGVGIAPQIDAQRSARGFMRQVLAAVPAGRTLGLVAYKEQFLLHLDRPVVDFGHRRWREGLQEPLDAAAWLAADPGGRILLLPASLLEPCFRSPMIRATVVGQSSRETWYLVEGTPLPSCVARGRASHAIPYVHGSR